MHRTVIFEHIPKTAGSTLNNILHKQYRRIHAIDSLRPFDSLKAFDELPRDQREQVQLVRGHGASLLCPSLPDAFVFTMLRDPLQRMLSQYRYLRTRNDHPSADAARSLSFADYLDHARAQGEDNLQTRFLSSLLPEALRLKTQEVSGQHLEEAKRMLQSMHLVLFTEAFDASLMQLKLTLGWSRWPVYTRQNESKEGPVLLDAMALQKVEDYERFDRELYHWAQSTFRLEPTHDELQKFSRRNALYGTLRGPYDLLKQALQR